MRLDCCSDKTIQQIFCCNLSHQKGHDNKTSHQSMIKKKQKYIFSKINVSQYESCIYIYMRYLSSLQSSMFCNVVQLLYRRFFSFFSKCAAAIISHDVHNKQIESN